jgi:hypothetical protein
MRFAVSLLAIGVFAATLSDPCSAATVRGTATDSSRGVIAGGKATIKNESTGVSRSTSTNAAGVFSFTDLAVGSYQVEITAAGFKKSAVRGIALDVADVRALDVVLEVGSVEEELSVDASGLAVQTVGGEVAGLVSGDEARELPLNGRNFLQLVVLMPGVSPADFVNLREKALFSFANISVSGGTANGNLYTVDGANNMDVGSNSTVLVSPSVDAIEEFKIHRNSYGAEYGQSAGAQVEIVTRGGTNEFHGSLYYFGRNEALDATNYFVKQAGLPKDKLRYHDFGFTAGGPVVRDKLHFFVSEEWNRSLRATLRSAFVPTTAEREGDFSGPPIAGCTPPPPVDPLAGEPFPGNRIPANRLSPGGLALMRLFPLPNTTPAPGTCNNWVASLDTPTDWRQDSVRLDWSPDPRTRLLLRYTHDTWSHGAPSDPYLTWGSDPFPGGHELEPALALARLPAQPGRRRECLEHVPVLVVGQPDRRRTGRHRPGTQRRDQRRGPHDLPRRSQVRRRRSRASRRVGRSLRHAHGRGALEQPDGPLRVPGRLLPDVRQSPVKGGGAVELQPEGRSRGRCLRRSRQLRHLGDRGGRATTWPPWCFRTWRSSLRRHRPIPSCGSAGRTSKPGSPIPGRSGGT